MGVNRYNNPAKQNLIDTYVPLPYKEMLLAGQSKQNQLDKLKAGQEDFLNQDFGFLQADRSESKDIIDSYNKEIDNISSFYGTDLTEAKRKFDKVKKRYAKDSGRFGRISAIKNNLESYNTYDKYLKDQVKIGVDKGGLSPQRADALRAEALGKYQGIGEGGQDGYNVFSGENAAKGYNYTKWVKDNLSDLEAITGAYANVDANGELIWTEKGSTESVSSDRILNAAYQLANGDQDLLDNIKEGDRLGLNSSSAFESSILGAKTKYSYSKKTRDKSAKANTAWQYQDKIRREKEKNKVIHGQSTLGFVKANGAESILASTKVNGEKTSLIKNRLDEINNDISSFKDANGRVKPEFMANYNEAINEQNKLQSELEKTNREQELDDQIMIEAFARVNNLSSILDKNPSINPDTGDVMIDDKTQAVAFYKTDPKTGEKIYIPISDYSSGKNELNVDDNLISFAKENNYELSYKRTQVGARQGSIIGVYDKRTFDEIDSRAAKSEDIVIDHVTDIDFKNSETLTAMQDGLFDNPDNFEIYAIDKETKKMEKSPLKISDAFKNQSKDKNKLLIKNLADLNKGDINEDEFKIRAKEIESGSSQKSRALISKEGSITGFGRSEDLAIFTMPNGDQFAFKPKGSVSKSSFSKQLNTINNDLASKLDSDVYKQRVVISRNKYENTSLIQVQKQINNQKASGKGITIKPKAINIKGTNQFLHIAKTDDNYKQVNLWFSDNPDINDTPIKGVIPISVDDLASKGTAISDNIKQQFYQAQLNNK